MTVGKGDRIYPWKTARKFISVRDMLGIIGTAGADTGQSNGGPIVAVQAGAGELGVLQVAAANDEVAHAMPIPWNLARDQKVLGRVVFCHSSTDADSPVFNVKTKFYEKQATIVDIDTSEDVSVAFTAHTCSTTAESLEMTDWTDLEWDQYMTDDDAWVGFILACTNTGSAGANEIEILGIELMWEIDAFGMHRSKTATAELEQPT